MKKFITSAFLLLISISFAVAQTQQPSSSPEPVSSTQRQQPRPTTPFNNTPRERLLEERRKQINAADVQLDSMLRGVRHIPEGLNNIYRKSKKEERELLAPNQEDISQFSKFLSQRKTGITKLVTDTGCTENSNIVIANEKCLKYSMPGAGSSYSFRINDYRIRHLSDLTFIEDKFSAFGILTQTLFVEIGDIPLDEILINSEAVKFLADFQPHSEFAQFKESHHKLVTEGIKNGSFLYKREISPVLNKTYAMRSIAYEGEIYRSFEEEVYNEFDFDQRKDVIIAFRVIRKSAEDITILWKELSRKNSPKLKNIPDEIE